MKYFRLLSLAACFALLGGAAHAQILQNHAKSHVIFVNTGGEKLDSAATEQVIAAYYNTIERGFQQSGLPRFIISGKDQKKILGIGGNVSLRASYDFGGIADNLDFITADIPVPNTERYNQQFQLDPSTSGLFFKAIAHAGKLGPIVGYISANFRGYQTTGFSLRDAYITVAGFTVGRRFTTFCDLTAVPTTVDFEGPNGYTTLFNTMIRYTHTFNAHWQIAVAAEMPDASITTSAATGTTTQRMPDFPVYAQYSWNKGMSHVRASAVFRDLDYYNERLDSRESQFGYGVQVSGEWQLGRKWTAYWQGIYGKGVAGYIQDIAGTGLDLVPSRPTCSTTSPTVSRRAFRTCTVRAKTSTGSWGMPTASRRSYSIISNGITPRPRTGTLPDNRLVPHSGRQRVAGPLTVNFRTLRL